MAARQPSVKVTFNGIQVPVEECSVSQNKKGNSNTFSCKIPLTQLDNLGLGLDWIAAQTAIDTEVYYSNDQDDFVLMFKGETDKIDIEFSANGQEVSLSHRCHSAKLKNKKSNEKFQNKTHQEIATDIAGRAGLTLNTDSGTGLAGRIYTAEQSKVTGNQSLWQLLRDIGEVEGKIHTVIGDQLYFVTLDDPGLPIYPVHYVMPAPDLPAQSSGQVSIKLGRNYEASKKHTVNVRSWDHKRKLLTVSTQSKGSGDPEQVYDYDPHHKTQDQTDRYCKGKLKEHTRHAFDLTIDMPGDTALTPLYQIALSGTNSAFDQNYHIDHIDHKMSVKGGYRMSISTKCGKDEKKKSS
ncbi:MAG: hypothetical protein JO278_15775 [Dyella sp.]|nr:hypothetical protein [Dyella sp.]